MALNLQKFVKNHQKLVEKKVTTRVSKVDLSGKKLRGEVKLHIVPDVNDLPMLSTKGVFEVHQTETYQYQDETRTRYPTYVIPSPENYNTVEGAVIPTDMQMKKLKNLYELLQQYNELSSPYQEGGPKLDSKSTKTQLWTKYISVYSKFWAKIAEIKPTTPDPKSKAIDTSKLLMVTYSSASFVKAFDKWATIDNDAEVSPEEQAKKQAEALSKDPTDMARCIKITTVMPDTPPKIPSIDIKNIKPESASVEITEEDISSATSLLQEDWDYTVFDDEKVDTLISRISDYLKDYVPEDEDTEEEEDEGEESEGNPFDDEE
jgi:hypothetical protein